MKTLILVFSLIVGLSAAISARTPTYEPVPPGGSMAVSPARFELEMKPGTETTVVVNLDYRAGESREPVRIVASLNDWTMTKDGRVEYFKANARENSASPWLIYTPGEAAVVPGTIHQIRVTIVVPQNALPGDHLTALIIEQRPEKLKYEANVRQMIVRYRMASVFYIKVPGLTKKGSVENLIAESTPDGVVVTPTLKNEGNSVIRPVANVKVFDTDGKMVADVPESEILPVLAGSSIDQPVTIAKSLAPGSYTVKYRIDFQDGGKAMEGVTDLVVKTQIAAGQKPVKKP
ncbi:MAG: hypothetical protein ABL999_11345 [Pyrinomonadaceae bacterium]